MVSVVRVRLDIVRSRDMEEAQDKSMLAGVVGVGVPSVAREKKRCTLAWLLQDSLMEIDFSVC